MIETDEETIIKGLMQTLKTIRKTSLTTQKNILLEIREIKEIYKHVYSELRTQNKLLKGSSVVEVLK